MDKPQQGRMLFSHNFDIDDNVVPQISREEFALYLINGCSAYIDIKCSRVNNPHWVLEVIFDQKKRSPLAIGTLCAQALGKKRKTQKNNDSRPLHILALGGIKTTPAISSSPTSLQPGEWGVDVVETNAAEQFLKNIDWEVTSASKSPESIFSFQLQV
ncbi:MAG: DUF2656 domain-containing protein [Richelia sp.]|nr:DUF2656 domain-containing protein [Richelia sp.]CDN10868.1 hypothetical protein RintRC_1926 [Richelia intracellularis]